MTTRPRQFRTLAVSAVLVALLAGCLAATDDAVAPELNGIAVDDPEVPEYASLPTHSADTPEIAPRGTGINAVFWTVPFPEFLTDPDGYTHLGYEWFALPARLRTKPGAVGTPVPVGDLTWWLTPTELLDKLGCADSQAVTIAGWHWLSTDGAITLTAKLRLGDVGEHALVARGRLGWRDGMPELRNPSPIDQTPGATLEFADTDTGRELAASNC